MRVGASMVWSSSDPTGSRFAAALSAFLARFCSRFSFTAASRFLFAIDWGRFDATALLSVHSTGIGWLRNHDHAYSQPALIRKLLDGRDVLGRGAFRALADLVLHLRALVERLEAL